MRLGERLSTIVRDRETGFSYRVDLGRCNDYMTEWQEEVLEQAPLPIAETDGLVVRVSGYDSDPTDFQKRLFLLVLDKTGNPDSPLEPGSYYAIPSFGQAGPIKTFHAAPDLHLVWIDETFAYRDKIPDIEDKIGRVWRKGLVNMAEQIYIASASASAFVHFVQNESEKLPDYDGDDWEETRNAFFGAAGFEDEQEFKVCGGEDDYSGYGEIAHLVATGESYPLEGFDETAIDAYRLHPMESVRRQAWQDIMEVAYNEAENLDRSVTAAASLELPDTPVLLTR